MTAEVSMEMHLSHSLPLECLLTVRGPSVVQWSEWPVLRKITNCKGPHAGIGTMTRSNYGRPNALLKEMHKEQPSRLISIKTFVYLHAYVWMALTPCFTAISETADVYGTTWRFMDILLGSIHNSLLRVSPTRFQSKVVRLDSRPNKSVLSFDWVIHDAWLKHFELHGCHTASVRIIRRHLVQTRWASMTLLQAQWYSNGFHNGRFCSIPWNNQYSSAYPNVVPAHAFSHSSSSPLSAKYSTHGQQGLMKYYTASWLRLHNLQDW